MTTEILAGLYNAIWVVSGAELFCYSIYGRRIKQEDGSDYGLVRYLYSRQMTIWSWLSICVIIDLTFWLVQGGSVIEPLAKLFFMFCYPYVMTEFIAIIWSLDDNE